jgi:sugar/nucleoside kinase (ribokinase family)
MDQFHLIRYIVAGSLRRDFIVTSKGHSHFDIPGGSVPYAAAGFGMWDTGLGLIGSVGEDFPQDWLIHFEHSGFDTRGISILPETIDLRSFIFYDDNERHESLNPITQFAALQLAIPKSLLGYVPEKQRYLPLMENQTPLYLKQIPSDYLDAAAAHICPLDLEQQAMLVSHFEGHINTISIDLSLTSLKSPNWNILKKLLKNIQILHISEEKTRTLFKGRSNNIWDMADELVSYGAEMVIIKRGKEGQFVYDSFSNKRWGIPAYPSRMVDSTGCGDAFCGGFMAGYKKTYDPVEAALHGNISASFSIEGTGAFYSMGVLPGLSEARMEKLRDMVKRF